MFSVGERRTTGASGLVRCAADADVAEADGDGSETIVPGAPVRCAVSVDGAVVGGDGSETIVLGAPVCCAADADAAVVDGAGGRLVLESTSSPTSFYRVR